eukprot:TRINITY_DN14543_c0_g1_i1.p1 TRINITY_DN14543_c0_g1~~TRINITY_DN14543_c0_g1_i1.p1  ORF type:complete len:966 (-),score=277.87 TRINITY_DN14543_c0_g1_i1:17-2860(-)
MNRKRFETITSRDLFRRLKEGLDGEDDLKSQIHPTLANAFSNSSSSNHKKVSTCFYEPNTDAKQMASLLEEETTKFKERLEFMKMKRIRKQKVELYTRLRQQEEEERKREEEAALAAEAEKKTLASDEELAKVEKKKQKMKEQRRLVIEEMLETEKSYVHSLRQVVEKFLQPLEKLCNTDAEVIPAECVRSIFSSIGGILNVNERFLNSLEARVKDWNDSLGIGDVFVQFAPYFNLYKDYINNHENAVDIVRALTGTAQSAPSFMSKFKGGGAKKLKTYSKNKKFINFMKATENETGMPLQSFLIMPVQRIPRYRLLLNEAKKNTEESHPDYQKVTAALEQVMKVADGINSAIKSIENSKEIFELQKRFEDPIELLRYDRVLLKTGTVNAVDMRKPKAKAKMYFFAMFSDLLIFAREKSSSKLVMRAQFPFNHNFVILDSSPSLSSPNLSGMSARDEKSSDGLGGESYDSPVRKDSDDEEESKLANSGSGAHSGSAAAAAAMKAECSFSIMTENEVWQIEATSPAEKEEWSRGLRTAAQPIYEYLLFESCIQDQGEVLVKLMATGCTMDVLNKDTGLTPLMTAVVNSGIDSMKVLVEKAKVDINQTNEKKETALMLAVLHKKIEAINYLLLKGADANLADEGDYTVAMHIVVETPPPTTGVSAAKPQTVNVTLSDKVLVKILSASNLNVQTPEGHTVFMMACQYGHKKIVDVILKEKLNLDIKLKDREGNDSLMHAIHFDDPELILILLELGCNMNERNRKQETPLIIAAKYGKAAAVKLLLERGADPKLEDKYRSTAFDAASTREIGNLLFSKLKLTAKRKSLHFEKEEILDFEIDEPPPPPVLLLPTESVEEPGDDLERFATLHREQSQAVSGELAPFTIVDLFFAPPTVEENPPKPANNPASNGGMGSRSNSKGRKALPFRNSSPQGSPREEDSNNNDSACIVQ